MANFHTSGVHGPRRVGRFLLDRELGRGGSGVVLRCVDPATQRPVAVKVLLDQMRATAEGLHRFQREAMIASRLRHPAIVGVLDAGVHDGRPFLVMELIEGEDLETLLRREAVHPRKLASIWKEVAQALEYAHQNQVVHRDVKPENVLVDAAGHARLTDFGIARDLASNVALTRTAELVGTPWYMAPEVVSGKAATPASDVYALGASLYRSLAGRPPFTGETPQDVFQKVLAGVPTPLRAANAAVPPALEELVLRCLARDLAARPQAAEVALSLARLLEARTASQGALPAVPAVPQPSHGGSGRTFALAFGGCVVVAGALFAGGALVFKKALDDERRARAEAIAKHRAEQLRHVLALARQRLARGDYSDVVQETTMVLSADPANAEALLIRAEAHLELFDDDAAEADYVRAIELDPKKPRALVQAGRLRYAADDHVRARQLAEKALALEPRSPGALALLACVQLDRSGDAAPARAAMAKALEVGPRDVDALSLAVVLEHRTQGGGELALLDRLVSAAPDDVRHLIRRGAERLERNDLEGAVADANAALEKNARFAQGWWLRAQIRTSGGDLRGALGELDRALDADPRFAIGYYDRARLRMQLGDAAGARADFERCVALPDKHTARAARASLERLRAK